MKPYEQITWHDHPTPQDEANTHAFPEALQPLRDAGELGAVHCQFPPWLVYRQENMAYLPVLRERFFQDRSGGSSLATRAGWTGSSRRGDLSALAAQQIALTVVDEPQLGSGSVPTVLAVTDSPLR